MSQMLRWYQGGLTMQGMLEMPYKQFMMLYEYMLWQLREQTEDGAKLNRRIERTDVLKRFGHGAANHNDGIATQKSFDSLKGALRKTPK
jgi:hypothetical protein